MEFIKDCNIIYYQNRRSKKGGYNGILVWDCEKG